jgi:phage internal scaffolding protein
MQFRKTYGYDTKQASDEATIKDQGESLTIQSQSEDTDINVMMKRFGITGQLPEQTTRIPEYGDYTEVGDYRSALHAVLDAQDNFMRLPPAVRARFDNDPQEFMDFATNPNNLDEMKKLGLGNEPYKAPVAEPPKGDPGKATTA